MTNEEFAYFARYQLEKKARNKSRSPVVRRRAQQRQAYLNMLNAQINVPYELKIGRGSDK